MFSFKRRKDKIFAINVYLLINVQSHKKGILIIDRWMNFIASQYYVIMSIKLTISINTKVCNEKGFVMSNTSKTVP